MTMKIHGEIEHRRMQSDGKWNIFNDVIQTVFLLILIQLNLLSSEELWNLGITFYQRCVHMLMNVSLPVSIVYCTNNDASVFLQLYSVVYYC